MIVELADIIEDIRSEITYSQYLPNIYTLCKKLTDVLEEISKDRTKFVTEISNSIFSADCRYIVEGVNSIIEKLNERQTVPAPLFALFNSLCKIADEIEQRQPQLFSGVSNVTEHYSAGTGEPCLPPELDTPRTRKYFKRAVDVGYMEITDTGYKWLFNRRSLASLGHFVEQVFCPNNTEKLPEQSINRLFGVSRICSAITQLHNAKKPQKWRAEIDKAIFYD